MALALSLVNNSACRVSATITSGTAYKGLSNGEVRKLLFIELSRVVSDVVVAVIRAFVYSFNINIVTADYREIIKKDWQVCGYLIHYCINLLQGLINPSNLAKNLSEFKTYWASPKEKKVTLSIDVDVEDPQRTRSDSSTDNLAPLSISKQGSMTQLETKIQLLEEEAIDKNKEISHLKEEKGRLEIEKGERDGEIVLLKGQINQLGDAAYFDPSHLQSVRDVVSRKFATLHKVPKSDEHWKINPIMVEQLQTQLLTLLDTNHASPELLKLIVEPYKSLNSGMLGVIATGESSSLKEKIKGSDFENWCSDILEAIKPKNDAHQI